MRAIFDAVTIEQQRGWSIASRAASSSWLRHHGCLTLRSSQTERAMLPIGTSRYFTAAELCRYQCIADIDQAAPIELATGPPRQMRKIAQSN